MLFEINQTLSNLFNSYVLIVLKMHVDFKYFIEHNCCQ
jgi:hypothetical protein